MSEPTITHTVDSSQNNISLNESVRLRLPVRAICGHIWVPKYADAPKRLKLPECIDCKRISRRPLRNSRPDRSLPHYVYRLFDIHDRLIYVGCTWDPKSRLDTHAKSSWWYEQVARTRVVIFPSRLYALEKEREAIGEENPRWNIRGRVKDGWRVEDFADFLHALKQNGSSDRQKDRVRGEAQRLFGVNLDEIEVAA